MPDIHDFLKQQKKQVMKQRRKQYIKENRLTIISLFFSGFAMLISAGSLIVSIIALCFQ